MKKIFEEYGGVVLTVIAIMALIGVVGILMGGENGGVVGKALHKHFLAVPTLTTFQSLIL